MTQQEIDTQKALIIEMHIAGVQFTGADNDKRLAWTYSRVGKSFATNRRVRHEAYLRGCENKSENAEGRRLGYC